MVAQEGAALGVGPHIVVLGVLALGVVYPAYAQSEPDVPEATSVAEPSEETGPPKLAREVPNVSIGIGALFLEPRELAEAPGQAPLVSARPAFVGRFETRLPSFLGTDRWLFEPHAVFVFPRRSAEGDVSLAGLAGAHLGYGLGPRWLVAGGLGLEWNMIFSSGGDVNIGGEFVTPSGTAFAWVATLDAEVGVWLDDRLRMDVGTAVSRLFDAQSRRFRYYLEAGYAL